MSELPYDQRLARKLVRPLARTPVTPNHLTALTLVLALASAGLFATGVQPHVNWAAGLFVLARFIDHFDGELARLKNQASSVGYYFDYAVGAISYAALFAGIAIGLAEGGLAYGPLPSAAQAPVRRYFRPPSASSATGNWG